MSLSFVESRCSSSTAFDEKDDEVPAASAALVATSLLVELIEGLCGGDMSSFLISELLNSDTKFPVVVVPLCNTFQDFIK